MLVFRGWIGLGVILCLTFFRKSESRVNVERDVVVSLSPRIPGTKSVETMQALQSILRETSLALKNAIGIRIANVIFHIPVTWNFSAFGEISGLDELERNNWPNNGLHADIQVDSLADSAFGKYPVALQYGGCGVPGLEISFPEEFLFVEMEYPKGKILAREWLKYRYGVFAENGFINDTLYPTHYSIPGSDDITVTDCTFPNVNYVFRDSENNICSLQNEKVDDCTIHPDEESAQNVSSSLMFYHKELPSVNHICGDESHPHNTHSPNKQNLLCDYKSILEIIQSSGYFDNKKLNSNPDDTDEIRFSYVQDSILRVVITWQNTASLTSQGELILNAVRKFMYDVPLHTKVGLYSFNDNIDNVRVFSELNTDSERAVQILSVFRKPTTPCISCILHTAIDVLTEDSTIDKGIIVIIANADPTKDEALIEKLEKTQLCLIVIGFSETSKEAWNNLIETSLCSSFTEINLNDVVELKFEKLYQVLESTLPLPTDDTRVKAVATGFLSENNPLRVSPDITANQYNIWIFGKVETDNVLCEISNSKSINISEGVKTENLLSFSFPSQMEEVQCKLKYESMNPQHLSQIQMVSKPGAYFNSHVWIYDTSKANDQMPVIIYAQLNYGTYPIRDAEVKAFITAPNGDKTEIYLFDNGRGDPDITKYDGIYSRYFTHFNHEGEYRVIVNANNNKKLAKFGTKGEDSCCGSVVLSEAVELGPFETTSKISFRANFKKPDSGYKPSRITDLSVDKLNLPTSLTLKWTAPGDEMDNGQAHSYILNSFTLKEDVFGNRFNNSSIAINVAMKPKKFGEPETFEINLDEFSSNMTYLFVLKSMNAQRQLSDFSNKAIVFIPKDKTIITVDPNKPIDNNNDLDSGTIGLIVGLVILAILIIIIIYLVIYFVFVRPKRKKERRESRNNTTAPRTSPFGVNSIPADVILKHHNEVVNAKSSHKDPPIFKEENIEIIQQQPNSSNNTSQNNNVDYALPIRYQNHQIPSTSPKKMTVV